MGDKQYINVNRESITVKGEPYNIDKKRTFWKEKLSRENTDEANKFIIITTPTDGDCFFDTIRKAYKSVGQEIPTVNGNPIPIDDDTIQQLRQIVASKIDLNKLINDYNIIGDIYTKNDEGRYDIPDDALKDTLGFDRTDEYKEFGDLLEADNYKKFVLDKRYWANESSIKIIQDTLNIIVINFEERIREPYIRCNRKTTINSDTKFIFLSYSGGHYELIGYKNSDEPKFLFKYKEIPGIVKNKFTNLTCKNVIDFFENKKTDDNINDTQQISSSNFSDEEMKQIIAVAIASLQKEPEKIEEMEMEMKKIIAVAIASLQKEPPDEEEEEEGEEEDENEDENEDEEEEEEENHPEEPQEIHNIIIDDGDKAVAYDIDPQNIDGPPVITNLNSEENKEYRDEEEEKL